MTKTMVPITKEMLASVKLGEPVERAVAHSDIEGIIFLQVGGGMWTAYNPVFGQSLNKRWQDENSVRNYLISRGVVALVHA